MAKLKELEEMAVFLADIVSLGDDALVDGKITWIEAVSSAFTLTPQIRDAFTGLKDVPAELKTATTADLNDLLTRVASRLKLRNLRTKEIAVKAVNLAIMAVDLINVIKNKPEMVQGFVIPASAEMVAPETI